MCPQTAGGTVLAVDDEPVVRRALTKKLTFEGYQCEAAGSGGEALELLAKREFDLLILDIRMPGRSGYDILPEIHSKYPEMAIIMSTGVTDIDTIIRCMKEGAHDYILKPFDLDVLTASVGRAMKIHKLETELQDYQKNLEQKVDEQTKRIRELFLDSIDSLVFALEAKDNYTAGHSRRVTALSSLIAHRINLDADQSEDLRWGALLHDLGKIAVDSAIQNKPGALTPDEYKHIMTHVQIGPDIVKPIANENIIKVIRHHHDRYDGHGLDQKLAGEDIPLCARIVAVADTFDAMTSNRPYRKAKSIDEAIAEMKRCSGSIIMSHAWITDVITSIHVHNAFRILVSL